MSFYGFIRGVARPFTKLMYRYKLEGVENIPQGAFILCANHLSFADPVCLACAFKPKIVFVAKSELNRGIFGKFLKKLKVVFINREQADLGAIRQSVAALKEGKPVGIFPQGTRVKGKAEASQALEGISMMCALGKVPALPVAIIYTKGKPRLFCKTRLVVGKPVALEELLKIGDRAAQSKYIFGKVCEIIDNETN